MSEFKFACPVCGQHITADSSTSGQQIECPTCFQKIVVPQAPASPDSKFILSASQVGKPRPRGADTSVHLEAPRPDRQQMLIPALATALALVCAAGAVIWGLRAKTHKASPKPVVQAATHRVKQRPRVAYPIPTNIVWKAALTNAAYPEEVASGSINGTGFYCERAILQGGLLTLRQGNGKAADLGITVFLHAQQGEELSGKSIEISPDRIPPLPRIVLRWKDDRQKQVRKEIQDGYALKVSFGQAANGRMPGKIYICLPDEEKECRGRDVRGRNQRPPPPKSRPSKSQK